MSTSWTIVREKKRRSFGAFYRLNLYYMRTHQSLCHMFVKW